MEYKIPSWSSAPPETSSPFQLEVLKDGSIVQVFELTRREYFFVGRQSDVVQILAEHPSISRRHGMKVKMIDILRNPYFYNFISNSLLGVFNFRDDGALMYLDLGSAQGSYINKSKCEIGTYYRCYVGDILRFGASSRQYLVCGPEEQRPEEYDSENMIKYRQKLALQSEKALEKKKKEESGDFASWGFDEDAVNPTIEDSDSDEEKSKKSKLPEYLRKDENYDRKFGDKFSVEIGVEVSENDKKILEKVKKKEKKIQNMQEEIRRIYLKENNQDGGLTEGQLAAVQRNDKSIELLKSEIESLVNTLQSKAHQKLSRQTAAAEKETGKRVRRVDDEDDVLDLTDQTVDSSTNWRMKKKKGKSAGAEIIGTLLASSAAGGRAGDKGGGGQTITYQVIKRELDKQRELLTSVQERMKAIESQNPNLVMGTGIGLESSNKGGSEAENEIDIDGLISKDQRADAMQALKKLRGEEQSLSGKVMQLEKLLVIATPALKSLAAGAGAGGGGGGGGSQPSGGAASISKEKSTDINNVLSKAPENPQLLDQKKELALTNTAVSTAVDTNATAAPISAVSAAAVGNSEPKSIPSFRSDESNQGKKLSIEELRESSLKSGGKPSPTTNSVSAEAATAAKPPPRTLGPTLPFKPSRKKDDNLAYGGSTLEGGDVIWIPPVSQSGDGKTSLNAKYGY